ncbi:GNAT family protein [Streptococcus anginosus]|uniref:GNAT family N-acetyltransferase n=2 Tax=Streptococcus anginosus TaxID=1328 RepID=A0AAW5TEJ9_STRAP|nr:GNAT family protein [Streptococcus anginosus]KAA9259702.1 GNAT family N-acetyltransferase [Streptococcus anginosus]KAA9261711.1 GNAT family N-acetyltransferase [Streptococcus anginosus]KAA9303234.1 GNAT family N-acetyltransferase [Streptococcus anginosus]MCW0948019.1 GNAT family N-acetyltransferase [Streptococcus anginosus]MCW0972067.1 GNAT family N-acetyltransferase [Streptococcus anginosus]
MKINELGQPIGDALPNFKPGDLPKMERLEGRYVIVECLSKDKHGADLYEVYGPDSPADMWTYLFQNPVQSQEEWSALLDQMLTAQDRFYYAIVDKESGKALGTFALMRINRGSRVIEVGSVTYSPQLKRTRLATEAQYLLARYVFEELEYRRYEWKCDALNQPSRYAAERLGFIYEGTFRQAVVYKGRNRDTDWLAMIDKDWAAVKIRLEKWLSPDNFDENGQQIKALSDF